jgi:hypothetical protein
MRLESQAIWKFMHKSIHFAFRSAELRVLLST